MVESRLSGRAYAARLRRWQSRGYRVSIVHLRLSSADQAVERVARGVVALVRRWFERSWSNLLVLHRDVADQWRVYDNSTPRILMARSPGWRGVRERRVSGYAESGTRKRIIPTKTRAPLRRSSVRGPGDGSCAGRPEGQAARDGAGFA
jgi:hypothetical protein